MDLYKADLSKYKKSQLNNGHEVKVTNPRGMKRLASKAIIGTAIHPEEVVQHVEKYLAHKGQIACYVMK